MNGCSTKMYDLHEVKSQYLEDFYAPGLKDLLGHLVFGLSVCLSIPLICKMK